MRTSLVLLALSFLHIHHAAAKALLAVFDSFVVPGKSYDVEWLSDSEEVSDYLNTTPRVKSN